MRKPREHGARPEAAARVLRAPRTRPSAGARRRSVRLEARRGAGEEIRDRPVGSGARGGCGIRSLHVSAAATLRLGRGAGSVVTSALRSGAEPGDTRREAGTLPDPVRGRGLPRPRQ